MWLIYQLYIELGIKPSYIFQILQNLIFLDKEEFCHLMILLIDNSVAKIWGKSKQIFYEFECEVKQTVIFSFYFIYYKYILYLLYL